MYHHQAHGDEHRRRTRAWPRRAGGAALTPTAAVRWHWRGDRVAAPSGRRARVTLGLAGCVPIGAAAAPGDAGPAALAAGYRAGWRIVPSPNGSRFGDHTLVQVSAGSATSAWAVGYHGGAGAFRTLIQRWDGARWALVRSPSPFDNVLAGVDTLSRASAWAVGYDLVNGYHRALIEHWDGAAWQVAPAPRAGPSDSDLWGVTALSATTRGRWATKTSAPSGSGR